MAQEFWEEQNQALSKEIQEDMERVIKLLNEKGVDFVVDGNKILIKCDIVRVDFDARAPRELAVSRPSEEIVISQGDKDIEINALSDVDVVYIGVRTPTNYTTITLPRKYAHVQYEDSYLVIDFSPKQ